MNSKQECEQKFEEVRRYWGVITEENGEKGFIKAVKELEERSKVDPSLKEYHCKACFTLAFYYQYIRERGKGFGSYVEQTRMYLNLSGNQILNAELDYAKKAAEHDSITGAMGAYKVVNILLRLMKEKNIVEANNYLTRLDDILRRLEKKPEIYEEYQEYCEKYGKDIDRLKRQLSSQLSSALPFKNEAHRDIKLLVDDIGKEFKAIEQRLSQGKVLNTAQGDKITQEIMREDKVRQDIEGYLAGCDLFLMSNPTEDNSNYEISDKSHLYLYKGEDKRIFYFIKEQKQYLEDEKQPFQFFQDAQFTSSTKKLIKYGNKQITRDVLNITSKRGHTHLASGTKPEGYYFHDDSKNNFFHKNTVREALLARMQSYYHAALLLVEYIKFPRKKLLQKRLEAAYGIAEYEIKIADQIFDFKAKIKEFINIFLNHSKLPGTKFSEEYWKGEYWKKALNEAEALVNWVKESKTVVTLTKEEVEIITPGGGKGKQSYTLAQFDIPVLSRTDEQFEEFSQLKAGKEGPDWLNNLQKWQQSFWEEIAKEIEANKKVSRILFSQPSTIRNYPDLPFYMRHGILIFNNNYEIVHKSIRCRSSIIVPYNLKDNGKEIQRLTNQNISQLITNELPLVFVRHWHEKLNEISRQKQIVVPILYQSLLTKLKGGAGESEMLDYKREQCELFEQFFNVLLKSNSDSGSIKCVFINNTNYAVNFGEEGRVGSLFTNPVDNSTAAELVIDCVSNYLELIYNTYASSSQYETQLNTLLNYLKTLKEDFKATTLNKSAFTGMNSVGWKEGKDSIRKEINYILEVLQLYIDLQQIRARGNAGNSISNLFLAALENSLVTAIGGLVLSSCKSGKDRNGLLQISTDALEVHSLLYGFLPCLMENNEISRSKHYDQLIVDLFKSGHQQIMASVNAQGCVGLKSVADVLPDSLFNNFFKGKAFYVANSDCANLNRPERIKNAISVRSIGLPSPSSPNHLNLTGIRGYPGGNKLTRIFKLKLPTDIATRTGNSLEANHPITSTITSTSSTASTTSTNSTTVPNLLTPSPQSSNSSPRSSSPTSSPYQKLAIAAARGSEIMRGCSFARQSQGTTRLEPPRTVGRSLTDPKAHQQNPTPPDQAFTSATPQKALRSSSCQLTTDPATTIRRGNRSPGQFQGVQNNSTNFYLNESVLRTEILTIKSNLPNSDSYAENSASHFFSQEKGLEFMNWYDPDICNYRLGMANNNAKCISVVFPDSPGDNNTQTFKNNLQQLVMLSVVLKRPALFISKEPGANNHFVCGLVKNNNLLLINPLGRISHKDCYATLAELKRENIIQEIWLSNNSLQKGRYEESLVSCGPITLELAINILQNFTPEQFDIFWNTNLKMDQQKTDCSSGLIYYDINIKGLLSNTLIGLEDSSEKTDYQNKVCIIRQQHYQQLRILPIQNTQNSNILVEDYLNHCKETDAQVVFNALITGEGLNNIMQRQEFKSLEKALSTGSKNDGNDSQFLLKKQQFGGIPTKVTHSNSDQTSTTSTAKTTPTISSFVKKELQETPSLPQTKQSTEMQTSSTSTITTTDEFKKTIADLVGHVQKSKRFTFKITRTQPNEICIEFIKSKLVLQSQDIENNLIRLHDALEKDLIKRGLKDDQYDIWMDSTQQKLKIITKDVVTLNHIGDLLKNAGENYWDSSKLTSSQVFFFRTSSIQLINNNNTTPAQQIPEEINCAMQ